MKDIAEVLEFLGVQFIRDSEGAYLSQSHYTEKIINRFGMKECKSLNNPAPGEQASTDE